ncbi:MAG: hypothetical protein DCC58_09550 [Chloroflexi bacterium]|nr:MAG: hypothetical protein DCC58_09550 [Chloroflexota bacterium]
MDNQGRDDATTPQDDRVVAERAAGSVTGAKGAGIRRAFARIPGGAEATQATEVTQAELSDVRGETVVLDRSGAERIEAQSVTMERSGAQTIDAGAVQMNRSGVVALGSDSSVLQHSTAVQVVAEDVTLTDSKVVWLLSERTNATNVAAILFSGAVDGDMRTVFTPKSAAVFGAACGAAAVVLQLAIRRFTRR